jgi:uncharacterized RDD family membrane protein YckC
MADVITGEAVALELPVANFPSRIAALLIDMLAQIVLLSAVAIVLTTTSSRVNDDYVTAAAVTAYVLVLIAYPTTFETLSRGKTLGKMALGIRVIGDDGSPVRFRQALVRALVGVFEIWTFVLAPVGLITSIISARGKRVGDIFAGTYVVQERVPARRPLPPVFATVPPPLAGWAQSLQVARLSDQLADAAGSYLRRFGELSPQARDALGVRLANAVAGQVSPPPPPGTPAAAYLSAVLAVRREGDLARFAAQQLQAPRGGAAGTFAAPPEPPAPPALAEVTSPPSAPAQSSPAPAESSPAPAEVTPAPPAPAEVPPAPAGFTPPA